MQFQQGRRVLLLLLLSTLVGTILIVHARVRAQAAAPTPSASVIDPNRAHSARRSAAIGSDSFGVQMYRDTGSTSTYNPFALESKAGTVRVDYSWPSSGPENTDWTYIDRYFAISGEEHGGLNTIVTMCCVPGWAAPHSEGPLHEEMYPLLAEFMGQIVERYDGDGIDDAPGSPVILYWEMYNEPDRGHSSDPSRRWGHNGDIYATMLSWVYPAMKAANPNAQIVMGGLAYDWFEDQGGPFVRTFIDDVLAAGGCEYFDYMNIHSFPFYASRWTDNRGAGVYEKTTAVLDKLAEYGCYRPILITESGWHSDEPPWNPSDEEEQARYVPQIFVQSFAAGADITVWWMLYDPPGNYWDNGLVTGDSPPQRKSSFLAYQTVRDTLLDTSFSHRFTTDELGREQMELYQFEDSQRQRTVYITWLNPVESTDTTTLAFAADAVTVQTLYGDVSTVVDADDGTEDGQTTVVVTAQPTYVFIDYPEPAGPITVFMPLALR